MTTTTTTLPTASADEGSSDYSTAKFGVAFFSSLPVEIPVAHVDVTFADSNRNHTLQAMWEEIDDSAGLHTPSVLACLFPCSRLLFRLLALIWSLFPPLVSSLSFSTPHLAPPLHSLVSTLGTLFSPSLAGQSLVAPSNPLSFQPFISSSVLQGKPRMARQLWASLCRGNGSGAGFHATCLLGPL